jgi:hypothetical protein
MIKESKAFPFEKLEPLLEPLLPLDRDYTTCTALLRDHKQILAKLYETGRPLLLEVGGHRLLLSDPSQFYDLENRRRALLLGCKTVEQALQVGKVELPDERINELARLREQIADEKRKLREWGWAMKQAKSRLSTMQAEAHALTTALKPTEK